MLMEGSDEQAVKILLGKKGVNKNFLYGLVALRQKVEQKFGSLSSLGPVKP